MSLWRLRNRARDLLLLLPLPLPGLPRPVPRRPRVEVAPAVPVPGTLIRLLPGAGVLLCAGLVASGPVAWSGCLAAALLVTWWPASPAAAGFSLAAGLTVLAGEDLLAVRTAGAAGPWRLAGAVASVHLVIAAADLASHVSWRAAVEARVLARAARGFLVVQGAVQAVVLIVLGARAALAADRGGEWWRAVAVVAVVAVALILLPREWTARRRP